MPTIDPRLYRQTAGFMGAPSSADASGARAAILGLPFDCGVDPVRVGARGGPTAIREQARRLNPAYVPFSTINPLELLGLVDCGDARVTPGRIEESYEIMEAAMAGVVEAGATPVTMGGDGAVTLPQLRVLGRRHPGLCLVHFDAHTDAYPIRGQYRYTNATTFTLAAEEGLIDTGASWHIGIRGSCREPDTIAVSEGMGYRVITADDLLAQDGPALMAAIRDEIAGRPVYLCWDMDFFDPSCAPGVCDPTWGGPTAREGLALLQALAGLNLVGCDVNTVSPPHDAAGMTALLAATVMLLCLHLLCLNPHRG